MHFTSTIWSGDFKLTADSGISIPLDSYSTHKCILCLFIYLLSYFSHEMGLLCCLSNYFPNVTQCLIFLSQIWTLNSYCFTMYTCNKYRIPRKSCIDHGISGNVSHSDNYLHTRHYIQTADLNLPCYFW